MRPKRRGGMFGGVVQLVSSAEVNGNGQWMLQMCVQNEPAGCNTFDRKRDLQKKTCMMKIHQRKLKQKFDKILTHVDSFLSKSVRCESSEGLSGVFLLIIK